MHPSAEKFRNQVKSTYRFSPEIKEFDEGTKTASDAADAIDCELGQIVKSLIMKTDKDYYLVLCSGVNEVDTEEMSRVLGAGSVSTASPDEVKEVTGWSIGGVPPLLKKDLPVIIDPQLLEFETVWAAAGTPQAVFSIAPERITDLVDVSSEDIFH